jgi:hypothetical protein
MEGGSREEAGKEQGESRGRAEREGEGEGGERETK